MTNTAEIVVEKITVDGFIDSIEPLPPAPEKLRELYAGDELYEEFLDAPKYFVGIRYENPSNPDKPAMNGICVMQDELGEYEIGKKINKRNLLSFEGELYNLFPSGKDASGPYFLVCVSDRSKDLIYVDVKDEQPNRCIFVVK